MNRELLLAATILPTFLIAFYLVKRAIRVRPEKFRLSDYFLAGGKIGPSLTMQNALGSNIALANGLWYFVVLGYFDGALGITAQVTWCLSIFLVGFFVPTILQSARRGETLHGFLGHAFNSNGLRVGCAFVTATGYLLNFGFETYVSGTILSSLLGGDERLKWIFVLALVLSSAMYISIAGFLGNVSQDRKQNLIGIGSMLAVAFMASVTLFAGRAPQGDHQLPVTVLVGLSWTKYLGIIAYTSLFNMVDVSNWQSVAANKFLAGRDQIPRLQRAWTKTALLAFVFPGVVGVFLGCVLRGKENVPDSQLFAELASLVLPTADPYVRSLVLGLVLMGFFVLALGYAENLLSAAQFTFMVDVVRRRRYDQIVAAERTDDTTAEEDAFVRGCQRTTFGIAIAAMMIFLLALRRLGEAKVFGFMFMIFGSATSMFPALLLATLRSRKGLSCDDQVSRVAAWVSVFAGYVVALSPLVFPALTELSPVFTVLTSTVCLVAIRLVGFPRNREEARI